MGGRMRIEINGEPREFSAAHNVASLLAEIGLKGEKVAVEKNLAIVPRSAFADTPVSDGDRLEIVHFIGGG